MEKAWGLGYTGKGFFILFGESFSLVSQHSQMTNDILIFSFFSFFFSSLSQGVTLGFGFSAPDLNHREIWGRLSPQVFLFFLVLSLPLSLSLSLSLSCFPSFLTFLYSLSRKYFLEVDTKLKQHQLLLWLWQMHLMASVVVVLLIKPFIQWLAYKKRSLLLSLFLLSLSCLFSFFEEKKMMQK